jgi:hypothetical protein
MQKIIKGAALLSDSLMESSSLHYFNLTLLYCFCTHTNSLFRFSWACSLWQKDHEIIAVCHQELPDHRGLKINVRSYLRSPVRSFPIHNIAGSCF